MHQIDLRGSIAPLTLLKVTRAFRTLQPGECLEVLSRDPSLSREIGQVLQRFIHAVEAIQPEGDYFRIRILKGESQAAQSGSNMPS